MIGSDLDQGDAEFDLYWGEVKGLVGNYMIECAIKTRMVQDYLDKNRSEHNVRASKLDIDARNGLNVGAIHEGNFELSLRETCNKIIHATGTYVSWSEKEADGNIFKYWNGSFHLHGTQGGEKWHLELNVREWARAMIRFYELLPNEVEIDIGQDWSFEPPQSAK